MVAQLILVDGIPGSGKSVVAQRIARRMRDADQPVRWWYEEELGHPIYLFSDAVTLQAVTNQLFSGAHQRVLNAAIDKWARFAAEAQHSGMTVVIDGTFFGYLTWTLHYLNRPVDEMGAYVRAIQNALVPLSSRLIYLRQRDVAATIRNVLAIRGSSWAERTIHKVVDSPYGRAHGLEGSDGLIRFWSDYQSVQDRLFDAVWLPKMRVDVEVGGWAAAEATITAWLDLPPARTINSGNPGQFTGEYRAPGGGVAHVEETDGALCIRGLDQVWPGQRLIAIASDRFEVLSLPFTLRFDAWGMTIEGPALLGGRPPARLDRLGPTRVVAETNAPSSGAN